MPRLSAKLENERLLITDRYFTLPLFRFPQNLRLSFALSLFTSKRIHGTGNRCNRPCNSRKTTPNACRLRRRWAFFCKTIDTILCKNELSVCIARLE